MKRENFLKLYIPNLPYCEFHLDKPFCTVSNGHSETIHVNNIKKNYAINIWWNCWSGYSDKKDKLDDGCVTVNYHDLNEKNKFNQIHTLVNNEKEFNQNKLNEVLKKIMY